MKKTLSLILALLMSASCASYILADDAIVEEPVEETAVEEAVEETAAEETVADSKYGYAIEFLNHYGIYKGKSADDLAAEDDIERYQMALFVARISTGWVDDEKWEDGPENWSEFTDINEGPAASFLGALSYANGKGIIEGYGDGKFGPSDGITYQNALTMVVRTLGYQGLDWPWGYIQKAVSLGLTEGITDVAYTDVLTRGEVAQIIYNALFAKTKDGTTLAMQSFGVEFGWEQAVIVASDLDTFIKDGDSVMKYWEVDGAGYGHYKADSIRPDDQYNDYSALVAFKLLNDDGTLGDDLYYAYAKDFGLSGEEHAHDDEAVVGHSYYVLFEKNTDEVKTQLAGAARLNAKNDKGGYVSIVDAISLLNEVVVNAGKTDDKGEAVETYPIDAYLKSYTLVTKYSNDTYVNVTAKTKPELLVFNKLGTLSAEKLDKVTFTIDWATGDILVPKMKDGKYVDEKDNDLELKEFEAEKVLWTVKYHWNPIREEYYEIVTEDYNTKDEETVLGYKRVSDETIEKFLGDSKLMKSYSFDGFDTPVESIAKTSAYATLTVFGYGAPERAIYESYRLGYFENTTEDCGDCNKKLATWTISDVGTYAKAVAAAAEKDEELVASLKLELVPETAGCKHKFTGNGRAWIVDGYAPEAELDEDGKEIGYKNGYVIYSYDKETGALKVVKNVNDGTDADSYVATGVLRAYDLKSGKVTIGDKTFYVNKYDELAGNGMRYAAKDAATRKVFSEYFRTLFNQYVEYVVVDGELVHVARKGATKSEIIVVDSYAGLSSDGYIVVNGYSTSTLKYEQFRIGSYDNWMKGDYYYYLNDKKAEESFSKGMIYGISSYDKDEDVYYVQLVANWNVDDEYLVFDTDYVNLTPVTIARSSDDRYMEYTTYKAKNYGVDHEGKDVTSLNFKPYVDVTDYEIDKTTSVKLSDKQKYIIVPAVIDERPYATIRVYEGAIGEGWSVTGMRINGTGAKDGTYVIVNATDIHGFTDTYNTSLVILLNDKYSKLDYNGAQAGDNWYLLGASVGEVEVFDVLSGKFDVAYTTTNKNLEVGHVYFTQDNVVTEDLGCYLPYQTAIALNGAYGQAIETFEDAHDPEKLTSTDAVDVAKYVFGTFEITKANKAEFFKDKDGARKTWIETVANVGEANSYDAAPLYTKLGLTTNRNIIDGLKVYAVKYEESYNTWTDNFKYQVTDIYELTEAKFDKLVKDYDDYTFYADYVYNVKSESIVIYVNVMPNSFHKTVIKEDVKIGDAFVVKTLDKEFDGDNKIMGQVIGNEVYVDDVLTKYELTGIEYYFDGPATKGEHAKIASSGYFFGLADDHLWEGYRVTVSGTVYAGDKPNGAETVEGVEWDSIVKAEYEEYLGEGDCEDCIFVQKIFVPFEKAITVDVIVDVDGKWVTKTAAYTAGNGHIFYDCEIGDANVSFDVFEAETHIVVDGKEEFVAKVSNILGKGRTMQFERTYGDFDAAHVAQTFKALVKNANCDAKFVAPFYGEDGIN